MAEVNAQDEFNRKHNIICLRSTAELRMLYENPELRIDEDLPSVQTQALLTLAAFELVHHKDFDQVEENTIENLWRARYNESKPYVIAYMLIGEDEDGMQIARGDFAPEDWPGISNDYYVRAILVDFVVHVAFPFLFVDDVAIPPE